MQSIHANRSLKRPDHPSPAPSFERNAHSRRSTGVVKRARWDVSSPMPSPPILSLNLPTPPPKESRQGFSFASTSSAFHFHINTPAKADTPAGPHRNQFQDESLVSQISGTDEDNDEVLRCRTAAFNRLRASTLSDGELFVQRMREWELNQVQGQIGHPPSGDYSRPDGSTSLLSNVPSTFGNSLDAMPSLSNSAITMTSSSSGSGSDAFSSRRKRSWSVIEDEDEDADDGYEMDWEMVKRSRVMGGSDSNCRPGTTGVFSHEDVDLDFVVSSSSSSSQQGDVESAMDDDEDDDDEELVFVLDNQDQPLNHTVTSNGSSERMLSELSQILDAGAGNIENPSVTRFPVLGQEIQAGALWD